MPKDAPVTYSQDFRSYLFALKPYLDRLGREVEVSDYIASDPILFMHAFEEKEDQLLAGFFASLMAWGRRDVVIDKTRQLLELMENMPYQFILNFNEARHNAFDSFKHRTFKPVDIYWLVTILHRILKRHGSFSEFWGHAHTEALKKDEELLDTFNREFFALAPEAAARTHKHISAPSKNSSCKRLCLFLRWAVRRASAVDLGLMEFIGPGQLHIPLDVHVARNARELGLLTRVSNDWKAVTELTAVLKTLYPDDPSFYDYALFGMGIYPERVPAELREMGQTFRNKKSAPAQSQRA